MAYAIPLESAVNALKIVLNRVLKEGDENDEVTTIIRSRDQVLSRYQSVFDIENLDDLTEEKFREFLLFRNNLHWDGLQRMGPAICSDMNKLKEALKILLNEEMTIRDRLNTLIPKHGPAYVPRLGRAILTPILMISHPKKYGVWNNVSEASMKLLNLWPEMERGLPFGDRYEKVNDILLEVAEVADIDLWTLDSLWWRSDLLKEIVLSKEIEDVEDVPRPEVMETAKFGLERHLHEFMRDNWTHIDLSEEWNLFEEDGDPEAGYEYPTDIGRIDLLAKHKQEPRWLVIELKRNQSNDKTVGQLLRYMGWVQKELASTEDSVEGLIISKEVEKPLQYALEITPNVNLKVYEVEFRLKSINLSPNP